MGILFFFSLLVGNIVSCGEDTSSSTTGGGRTPVGCIPSENADAVGDECGVFVSSTLGVDTNDGSKSAPVQTVAEALARAATNGTRVYACAEAFDEAIEVPAGMTIFGGLDCANGWRWIGETTKTTIAAPADMIAMRLTNGEGTTRIEDVAARAADATMEGGSSIAVLIDGATAELARCELTAGNAADGAKGAPGAEPAMLGDPVPPAQQGAPGNKGNNACSDLDMMGGPDATLPGGAAVQNACDGDASVGGKGGDAEITQGNDGEAGTTGSLGQPGLGEPQADPNWQCAVGIGAAQLGAAGAAGDPGMGASGLGTLKSSSYVGVSGGAGTIGKSGQGGGGGGGAKGTNNCAGGAGAGASGGSGGAGGCGGKPGQGGGAGGASIALASVNASVTLTDCTLTAGNGGNGGDGGDFQPGGDGGTAGLGGGTGAIGGIKAACAGGAGGRGGDGGPGGGGLGGPSLAIAFAGTAVMKSDTTTLAVGVAGTGGLGGSNNAFNNAGAGGVAAQEQELP